MIRSMLWRILQNILRLIVTLGIPILALWQGEFLDHKAEGLPWWVAVAIGALIGGFVATPASNIGNLIWEILGVYLRRGVKAPRGCTEEETRVLRELEYKKWVWRQQNASLFVIAGSVIRRVFLPILIGVALLFVPLTVAVSPGEPIVGIILAGFFIVAITAMVLALGFGIATGLGIKSFHHQE